MRNVCRCVARRDALWRLKGTIASYDCMMRIFAAKPPYSRRLRKSRRGIIIASALTLAAVVLTLVAIINGATDNWKDAKPVAVQERIN
ncbi:MAG: hypothetical protein ACK5KM_08805 [Hyphomicrobiaceae bacterium]